MNTKRVYSRKISSTEANNGYVFILKSKLSFFPEGEFELEDENLNKKVKVESYPCTCRGPNRAHKHYFIHWEGLKAGDRIEIKKSFENENKYNLKVISI